MSYSLFEMSFLQPVEMKCFLCQEGGRLMEFTDKAFQKCKKILELRKKYKFRYSNVSLPDKIEAAIGYHSKPCYSSFTALGKRYRADLEVEKRPINYNILAPKIKEGIWSLLPGVNYSLVVPANVDVSQKNVGSIEDPKVIATESEQPKKSAKSFRRRNRAIAAHRKRKSNNISRSETRINSMPLQQRISLSQPPTPTLKSQPLSPTKLKVTRQSTAKPQQQISKEESKPSPIDEAICLRWKTHHSNMQTALPSLLSKEQYCDVSLVAEGKILKCHKLILSSCSPYFDQMFEHIMPYQHPVVFMKDIPFRILKTLCDFMYAGEVNILQSDLEQLLDAAGSLKIKGLEPQTDAESTNIPTVKANEERAKEPAPKKFPHKQSSSEKKSSPPSGDMIDPLDLLKPIYEEAAVPDNVPTLKRNDQTRRSSAKRVRKRKHIEDDHEPSPPIFRTRKGTRSRPNVRVPRYFNASFDNSSMEKGQTEVEQSQPSGEASLMDPFMDILEEIKTEPLDIEDGEISYSEEIFDDTSEQLTENVEPEDVDSPFTKRAKTSHIPCVQPKLIVTKQEDDAPDPLGVEVLDDRLRLNEDSTIENSNQGDSLSTAPSETHHITDESTLNREEMIDSQEDVANQEEIADSQESAVHQEEIVDPQEHVVSGVMLLTEHHKIDDNISNHEEMEDSASTSEMTPHHKTTDDGILNHEEMVDSREDFISSKNAEESVIEMNTLSTIEMGEPKAMQCTPELVVNETSTQIITDTVDETR